MTDSPFASRLARTPYLVIPRLALEAMPIDWQDRFEALMVEMESSGLKTPDYLVFRDNPPDDIRGAKVVNEENGFVQFVGRSCNPDPWANYRRGDAWELSGGCRHEEEKTMQTGDGTPVGFCPDCGRNRLIR